MRNIIATWICIDDKKNGTIFPSAKGNSADKSIQEIYWRCVCTFFTTAAYHNPTCELMLFSNTEQLPFVGKTSIKDLLTQMKVQFYVTNFEYITPNGYYKEWRNQFYEFSIFKFISAQSNFNDDDNFLLLDSDCIIRSDLSGLFELVKQHKCITYLIKYDINQKINGISRLDMKVVFEELLQKRIGNIPGYHGGEFFAATVRFVKQLLCDFCFIWPKLLERNAFGLQKLNEEAHVLSYLYFKNKIEGGEANCFIKRLWTDPSTYRNVEEKDAGLPIWHLPAEKRKGFKIFFFWLQSFHFKLDKVSNERYEQQVQKTFLIPIIPIRYLPYYTTKALIKRVLYR